MNQAHIWTVRFCFISFSIFISHCVNTNAVSIYVYLNKLHNAILPTELLSRCVSLLIYVWIQCVSHQIYIPHRVANLTGSQWGGGVGSKKWKEKRYIYIYIYDITVIPTKCTPVKQLLFTLTSYTFRRLMWPLQGGNTKGRSLEDLPSFVLPAWRWPHDW